MIRTLAALLLLANASPALSAEAPPGCEIPSDARVQVSMTTVYVNGTRYPMQGRESWEAFAEELDACDMSDASAALQTWRADRRSTNTVAGLSTAALVVPPVGALCLLVVTPVVALSAGDSRRVLEQKIREGQRRNAHAGARVSQSTAPVVGIPPRPDTPDPTEPTLAPAVKAPHPVSWESLDLDPETTAQLARIDADLAEWQALLDLRHGVARWTLVASKASAEVRTQAALAHAANPQAAEQFKPLERDVDTALGTTIELAAGAATAPSLAEATELRDRAEYASMVAAKVVTRARELRREVEARAISARIKARREAELQAQRERDRATGQGLVVAGVGVMSAGALAAVISDAQHRDAHCSPDPAIRCQVPAQIYAPGAVVGGLGLVLSATGVHLSVRSSASHSGVHVGGRF